MTRMIMCSLPTVYAEASWVTDTAYDSYGSAWWWQTHLYSDWSRSVDGFAVCPIINQQAVTLCIQSFSKSPQCSQSVSSDLGDCICSNDIMVCPPDGIAFHSLILQWSGFTYKKPLFCSLYGYCTSISSNWRIVELCLTIRLEHIWSRRRNSILSRSSLQTYFFSQR